MCAVSAHCIIVGLVLCCLGLGLVLQCRLDIQCRGDFVNEVITIMHIFVFFDIVGKQIPILDIVIPIK